MTYPYFYAWGNNSKRATMKGRRMQVIARGAMNSALVEFENGQREIISRNAIRKAKTADRDGKRTFTDYYADKARED